MCNKGLPPIERGIISSCVGSADWFSAKLFVPQFCRACHVSCRADAPEGHYLLQCLQRDKPCALVYIERKFTQCRVQCTPIRLMDFHLLRISLLSNQSNVTVETLSTSSSIIRRASHNSYTLRSAIPMTHTQCFRIGLAKELVYVQYFFFRNTTPLRKTSWRETLARNTPLKSCLARHVMYLPIRWHSFYSSREVVQMATIIRKRWGGFAIHCRFTRRTEKKNDAYSNSSRRDRAWFG